MRKPYGKYGVLTVLVLALLLGLLLAAGPAWAGDPFPGNGLAYGPHEWNAVSTLVGDVSPTVVVWEITTDDPLGNGRVTLTGVFTLDHGGEMWLGDDGYWHVSGSYVATTADGSAGTVCYHWDHYFNEKHGFGLPETAYGFGDWDGLVSYTTSSHSAPGPWLWVSKGWTERVE